MKKSVSVPHHVFEELVELIREEQKRQAEEEVKKEKIKQKMKLYKILDKAGRSCHGGKASWPLPKKGSDGSWEPGGWMDEIAGDLILCSNGYHLCRTQDVIGWLGETIYEAEYEGEQLKGGAKIVVRKCRLLKKCEGWTEESARLFACWCVRNTPLTDGRKTWNLLMDKRSRAAVETAERYAKGEANEGELNVARAAAWAVAEDAARAAARAAAWAAARAAAWAVAGEAAWAAAGEAAWAAARAAAWEAARAAAWAAAGEAAWAVAEDAARAAQTKELFHILKRGE